MNKSLPRFCTALATAFAAFALIAAGSAPSAEGELSREDAAAIKAQLPLYPLETCAVSGEALEDPVDKLHEGRLVRFCCSMCVKSFDKDPATFLADIDAAVIRSQKASYPLDTCPISGEEHKSARDIVWNNRMVSLCCKRCEGAFEKDPAKTIATIDAALIRTQKASYPMDTCLVSGEPLGDMGEPVDFLYGTRLVRLCCDGCQKGFDKDPAAAIAKLDKAMKRSDKKDMKKDEKADKGL